MILENKKNSGRKIKSKIEQKDHNTEENTKKNNTDGKEVLERKECDCCIRCRRPSNIPMELEIDFRPFYVEGAGQLCYDCYHEIYG